jgi:hypothetical protein
MIGGNLIHNSGEVMKEIIKIVLAAILVLMGSAIYAAADDDDEERENGIVGGENEERDEDENRSVPGFEVALAIAGGLAAARLMKR